MCLRQARFSASRGRIAESERLLATALRLDPQHPEARHDYALMLHGRGQSAAALRILEGLAAEYPQHPGILNNLANLRYARGDQPGALAAYASALALAPDDVDALLNHAKALTEAGRLPAASQALERAIALAPDDAQIRIESGALHLRAKRTAPAEAAFRLALALQPSNADAVAGLGSVALIKGETEQAIDCYRTALQINPNHPTAHLQLARSPGPSPDRLDEIEAAMKALERTSDADSRATLLFALGHLHEKQASVESAFDHFRHANHIVRNRIRYDADILSERITQSIAAFGDGPKRDPTRDGNAGGRYIFVAGPPRSGTSLAEQILSSHPIVSGMGEAPLLHAIAHRLGLPPARAAQKARSPLGATDLAAQAALYEAQASAQFPSAGRIVDKGFMVGLYLGLAASLFPGASFVEIRREPVDVAWSMYTERFAAGTLAFAYDLTEIGRFLCDYERLMRHWRQVLGPRMLTLDYAELVTSPRLAIARLLEHCRLPWDEACLQFQRSRREVFTASAWQVRQPLYTRSRGRARKFEPLLDELFRALQRGAAV